ncbi:hypothetical protein [Bradyrhizobium sp. AUGA SZCCT0177]|nr:hypothetical protein [Bradyrhizobium sp. AUGA SZCCT0177]
MERSQLQPAWSQRIIDDPATAEITEKQAHAITYQLTIARRCARP